MRTPARVRRDRLATLDRRRRFLADRVASYRRDGSPDRDRAELAAINWALQIVRAAERSDVLDDLEAVAVPMELTR